MSHQGSNKSFIANELAGIFTLCLMIGGGFTGGSLLAKKNAADAEVERVSIYVKCYQIAQFMKEQEEDMGSHTTLPDRLLLRCEELSNG